ncbi:hypothetical protein [Frankia sp. EAN1pec]
MTVREFVSGLAFIARDMWRRTPRPDLYLDCDVCSGAVFWLGVAILVI